MVKRTVHIAQYVVGCLVWAAAIASMLSSADDGDVVYAIAPALLGGLISGATSAAGGIVGGIKSLFEKRKLEEQRNTLATINRGIQGRELSQTSRAAIRRAEENADEAQRKNNTQAIKGGATDEARIANDARVDDYVASVTSAAYGADQRSKDASRDRNMILEQNIMQQEAQNAVTGAQNLTNAVAAAGNVLGSAVADGKQITKNPAAPSPSPLLGRSSRDDMDRLMKGRVNPIRLSDLSFK